MNESICFTVEEYKSTFQYLLNEFILATAKTELDFFEYQLEIYNNAHVISYQDFEGELYGGTIVNMDKFQEVIAFIRVKIAKCKYGKSEVEEIEVIKPTNFPEKWYALLYWIELTAHGQLPPRNSEGQFIKKEIEEIGKNKTGKSGQGFYRSFIEIDLNNTKLLNNHFGQNWKNEVIKLSENDTKVTEYIQSKYTS